jgi:hypothetical protein
MSPIQDQDDDRHGLVSSDLKVEFALMGRDIDLLKKQSEEIKKELSTLKGYFTKAFMGAAGLVGLYFIDWLLTGGISHVVLPTR